LYELDALAPLDMLQVGKEFHVLTDRGEAGSQGLITRWWLAHHDYKPAEFEVLQRVNELSCVETDNHAYLRPVSVKAVIDSLEWKDRSAEMKAYLGANNGPHQIVNLRTNLTFIDNPGVAACEATYQSQIFQTHSRELVQQLIKYRQRFELRPIKTDPIDLSIITNGALRTSLESDLRKSSASSRSADSSLRPYFWQEYWREFSSTSFNATKLQVIQRMSGRSLKFSTSAICRDGGAWVWQT
jgi:hypothetical protein